MTSAAVRWSLIAAADRRGVIGVRDASGMRLPWHLPEDLKHFKRTTIGRPVVMGRRTWQSIGRALPGRLNVVLTRDPGFAPGQPGQGVVVAHDADAAARALPDDGGDAFVIGGAEVFAQFLPLACRIHLTEIDRDFDGDCVFAPFARGALLSRGGWRETSRERHESAAGFGYDFVVYERPAS